MNQPHTCTLSLVGLAMLAVCGCEMGPPEVEAATTSEQHPPINADSTCGGPAPACVLSCGQSEAGPAGCVDGRWMCSEGFPVTSCPDYKNPCSPDAACGLGYTCVASVSHPIPAEKGICRKWNLQRDHSLETCGSDGLLAPSQLYAQSSALIGQIVKVMGVLDMSLKCSDNACPQSNPCCNTCKGHYVLVVSDPTDPTATMEITIRKEAVACSGTTCDVSCSPWQLDDTYVMWGVLDSCAGSSSCTMLYMGSCQL